MESVILIATAIGDAVKMITDLVDVLKNQNSFSVSEAQQQVDRIISDMASDEARLRRMQKARQLSAD